MKRKGCGNKTDMVFERSLTIKTALLVTCLIAAAAVFCGCEVNPSGGTDLPEDGENGEETVSARLTDGTPVFESYLKYFESLGAEDPLYEAKVFAAKLSYCDKELPELTEEALASYGEKTDRVLEYLKSSGTETYDETCKRLYGLSYGRYKTVAVGNYRIAELLEKVKAENKASPDEAAAYLDEKYGGLGNMIFLRAFFDGSALPVLPEGTEIAGYPADISLAGDFKALLETIGDALNGKEEMKLLIENNAQESDENIVVLREMLDNMDTEEKEGLQKEVGNRIKGTDDICVFFDGNHYVLLYCIEYETGETAEALESAGEFLTEEKAKDVIQGYISGLIG